MKYALLLTLALSIPLSTSAQSQSSEAFRCLSSYYGVTIAGQLLNSCADVASIETYRASKMASIQAIDGAFSMEDGKRMIDRLKIGKHKLAGFNDVDGWITPRITEKEFCQILDAKVAEIIRTAKEKLLAICSSEEVQKALSSQIEILLGATSSDISRLISAETCEKLSAARAAIEAAAKLCQAPEVTRPAPEPAPRPDSNKKEVAKPDCDEQKIVNELAKLFTQDKQRLLSLQRKITILKLAKLTQKNDSLKSKSLEAAINKGQRELMAKADKEGVKKKLLDLYQKYQGRAVEHARKNIEEVLKDGKTFSYWGQSTRLRDSQVATILQAHISAATGEFTEADVASVWANSFLTEHKVGASDANQLLISGEVVRVVGSIGGFDKQGDVSAKIEEQLKDKSTVLLDYFEKRREQVAKKLSEECNVMICEDPADQSHLLNKAIAKIVESMEQDEIKQSIRKTYAEDFLKRIMEPEIVVSEPADTSASEGGGRTPAKSEPPASGEDDCFTLVGKIQLSPDQIKLKVYCQSEGWIYDKKD